MESFEKLEIILQGMINDLKHNIEREKVSGAHPAYPYVNGLEHELVGLQKARSVMLDIKNNGHSVSDAMIEKFWKSKT